MGKYLYKPTTWQGFVQQIVFLMSKGYRYYYCTQYPEKKKDRFDAIDMKLIEMYQTNQTRSQRVRSKEKGCANFFFLRFNDIAIVLMATNKFEGKKTKTREDIIIDHDFLCIDNRPLSLNLGRVLALKIHTKENRITVSMDRRMFLDKKAELQEVSKRRSYGLAQREFGKLNGLPAYHGIIQQKKELLAYLVSELKRHGVDDIKDIQEKKKKLKTSAFYVKMERTKFKVYND
jgi:hypothetical protein